MFMHMACDIVDFISFVTFKRKIVFFFFILYLCHRQRWRSWTNSNTEKYTLYLFAAHSFLCINANYFASLCKYEIHTTVLSSVRDYFKHTLEPKKKNKINFMMLHKFISQFFFFISSNKFCAFLSKKMNKTYINSKLYDAPVCKII